MAAPRDPDPNATLAPSGAAGAAPPSIEMIGPASHTLDAEVSEAIGDLRAAYADLLAAIPGDASSSIAVERTLGLNKKLAWQVYRVATAPTPLVAGTRVPGTAAARQVVRAAERLGIDAAIRERIVDGTAAFLDTVNRHADDRSSFDLMVSAVSGDGLAARDEELKRTAFRATRQLAGRYCDVDVYTILAVPGDEPGTVHMCSLRGLVGLRRLRPGVRLEISRHRFDKSGGAVDEREAIVEPEGDVPVSVLREFSSQPLPPIRQSVSHDGFVRTFLETRSLGADSAATCFVADVNRNSNFHGSDGSAGIGHIHRIATPARLLLQDALIDERLIPGDRMPELRILASPNEAERWPPGEDTSALLPVAESVERIGRGPSAVAAPEVPRYAEMVAHVADRLGWDAGRLVVHRARIDHPISQSVAWMRFDLAEIEPALRGTPPAG